MISKYPNTFYRVSAKAIIRNEKNEVLLVKEMGSAWSFPGGGIDHGETIHETFKRELYEEILLESDFTYTIFSTETMFVKDKETWLLWIVCELKLKDLKYGIGEHANEVAFIDPSTLKDSEHRSERLVYKFTRNNPDIISKD